MCLIPFSFSLMHIVRTWPGLECSRELKSHCMCNCDKAATLEKCPGSPPPPTPQTLSLCHALCQLSSCERELDKDKKKWDEGITSEGKERKEDEQSKIVQVQLPIYCMQVKLLSATVYIFKMQIFLIPVRDDGVSAAQLRKPPDNFFPQRKSFPYGQQKQAQTVSRAVWEALKEQENRSTSAEIADESSLIRPPSNIGLLHKSVMSAWKVSLMKVRFFCPAECKIHTFDYLK